jgi:hypothetical protein
MQKLDEGGAEKILERKWRVGHVLQVDGIVFLSERVMLVDAKTVRRENSIRCVATPFADTDVTSVLKYNPDPWVAITQLDSIAWDEDINVVCGEGAMGNEGFVAVVDRKKDIPIWVLFSTCSNPFESVARDGEDIVASAGYDQAWRLPMEDPTKFAILDEPP